MTERHTRAGVRLQPAIRPAVGPTSGLPIPQPYQWNPGEQARQTEVQRLVAAAKQQADINMTTAQRCRIRDVPMSCICHWEYKLSPSRWVHVRRHYSCPWHPPKAVK